MKEKKKQTELKDPEDMKILLPTTTYTILHFQTGSLYCILLLGKLCSGIIKLGNLFAITHKF